MNPSVAGYLAQAHRVWNLSQELHMGMPVHPYHPPYFFTLARRHGDAYREGGYSSADEVIILSGHHGTHVDALGHVSVDGSVYGGAAAAEIQRGTRGLRSADASSIDPMVCRGVLIDVARALGVKALAPGQEISIADMSRALEQEEAALEEGDAVLIRTGWGRYWATPSLFYPADGQQPGIGTLGARWLAECGCRVIGSDTMVVECVVAGQNRMPVHELMLRWLGIHLMEMLALEEISEAGVHEFVFLGLPLRIAGATGAPLCAIAVDVN